MLDKGATQMKSAQKRALYYDVLLNKQIRSSLRLVVR